MPCRRAIDAASRLLVGSSSTMTAGSSTAADATASRCCWPPDRLTIARSSRSSMPKRAATCRTRSRIRGAGMPTFSHGNASSSVERAWKYWVLGFWNTLPTTRAYDSSGARPASRPPVHACPVSVPVKCPGASPLIRRVTVVLPQPLGPTSITSSPARTCSVTLRRAAPSPLYANVQSRTSHNAVLSTPLSFLSR